MSKVEHTAALANDVFSHPVISADPMNVFAPVIPILFRHLIFSHQLTPI